MKNINFRSVFWLFLIAFSLCSYFYLNTVSVENAEGYAIEEPTFENPDGEEAKVIFPDIALIKKIIDLSKMVIPQK